MDVFESEPPGPSSAALIAHPKTLCTPHLGASTEEAQKKVAREIAQQMSDAFAGKEFVGVVNCPFIAYAHSPAFSPYVKLTESLGSLQGQTWTLGTHLRSSRVSVELSGPIFTSGGDVSSISALFSSALLKGLLPALPTVDIEESTVNLVNAQALATREGIDVAVTTTKTPSGPFSNSIRVSVTSPGVGTRTVVGAVLDGKPRIVQVDSWTGFPSIAPEGHILFFNNADKPGAVSKVTSVLADYGINIASLSVVRQGNAGQGEPALSVIISDQRVPSDVKSKIEHLDGISNVRSASFTTPIATSA